MFATQCFTRQGFVFYVFRGIVISLLALTSQAFAAATVITEFYNTALGHYVLITTPGEVAFIESGGAGAGWQKTGKTFSAYTAPTDAPGLVPVCRFYGSVAPGPNSHFFTADPGECSAVKNDPGWHYEGVAFYVFLPTNGLCAAAQLPVWRAYNNGYKPQLGINNGNHRFSTDRASIQTLVTAGWTAEGVVFCASNAVPTPSLNINVSASSVLLMPGAVRDIYVTLTPQGGFSDSVTLTVAGLPLGASYQLSPATVSVSSSPVSVRLRLSASTSALATSSLSSVTVDALGGAGGGPVATFSFGIAAVSDPMAVRLGAIAAVEDYCRELDSQGLSPTAYLQSLSSFMAARPEYDTTGVDLETFSVWGRFKDGTFHVVADNRKAAPGTANVVQSDAIAHAADKVDLPAVAKARLLHSFGTNFEGQEPIDQMRSYLQGKGWSVRSGAEGEAGVGTLKGISGDGFFYLNTHGGRFDSLDPSEPERKIVAIQSSTLVDSDYERLFDADLKAVNLVHFTARNGDKASILGISYADFDTRYAITYRFVDKYMSFTQESVVFINACFSSRNDSFVKSFLRKGAGVFLGWSGVVDANVAYKSAPYFVDRMLGSNQYADKETPPQRAFSYNLVLTDMAKKGLDAGNASGASLQSYPNSTLANPPIFAPSIRYVNVDESQGLLYLVGEFGTGTPKVTVGGKECSLSGSPTLEKIRCSLPLTGEGSSGDVVVEVRGVKSNARQLSEWAIPLKYSWLNPFFYSGLKFEGPGTLRFRADVAGYRMVPAEGLRYRPSVTAASNDSLVTLTGTGSYVNQGCTVTLSGKDTFVSPSATIGASGAIIANAFWITGDTRQAELGLAFGLTTSPFKFVWTGNSGCASLTTTSAPTLGLLDGVVYFPFEQADGTPISVPFPALKFTLDSSWGLPAMSKPYATLGGTLTLSWTAVPAKSPPRNDADAGK